MVRPIQFRGRTTGHAGEPAPARGPRANRAQRRAAPSRAVAAGSALLLAGVLAACGGDSAGGSGASDDGAPTSFGWGYPTMASSLDPHQGGSFDIVFMNPLYDSLLRTDESGEFIPGLATEWELSEDGLTLDLTLREDVTFSDGAEMDAEAVKASLERALDPTSSTSGDIDVVESIEITGPMQIRLNMSAPGAHVLGALATEAGMIVSPEALGSPDLARQPVGAGPYKLVSFTNDQIEYETWDGYWDPEAVEADELLFMGLRDDSARLRALQSGPLDAAYLRPSQLNQIKAAGLEVLSKPRTLIYTMQLNTSRSGLGNADVRRALMRAVDRGSIDVNLQNDGCTPTVQPFIEGYWPHVPGLVEDPVAFYDPEEAKQLLAKAGYGPDNPLQLTITSTNISQYQQIAEAMQAQLAQVGIDAELRVVESTQSTATVRAGDYDIYIGPIDVGRPDPTTFVADYYLAGGALNPGGFDLPGGKELLAEARTSTDVTERAEPMQELMKQAFEAGPPVIPICAPDNVIGTKPGVTGVIIPQFGTYEFRNAKAGD